MVCQLRFTTLLDHNDIRRFQVKRPDGGNFIAYAHVADDIDVKNNNVYNPYWAHGYMTRCAWCRTPEETQTHDLAYESVSANCRFTDRYGGWEDNLSSDWEAQTKFIVKGKDSLSPEEYKRITDKGYIFGDTVQTVIFKAKLSPDDETLSYFAVRLLENKIPLSEELIEFSKKLDEEALIIFNRNAFSFYSPLY